MTTRTYEIKNAEFIRVHLDAPRVLGTFEGEKGKFFVAMRVSEDEAAHLTKLIEEVRLLDLGGLKSILGLAKVYDCKSGGKAINASSNTRPLVRGVPYSKGLKLDLLKKADVKVEILSFTNHYGKGVVVELKEVSVVSSSE